MHHMTDEIEPWIEISLSGWQTSVAILVAVVLVLRARRVNIHIDAHDLRTLKAAKKYLFGKDGKS